MKVKTIKGNSFSEIKTAIEESIVDVFNPTLAIVFVPYLFDMISIRDLFVTKGISVFGSSSFGNFIDRSYDKESIVAMLFEINPDYFRIIFKETGNKTTKEIAISIGQDATEIFAKPSFIIGGGGVKTDGEMIVDGILEGTEKKSKIFGGLASGDFSLMKTTVFDSHHISDDAIVALILDEEHILLNGLAVGGWKPLGIYHTITKSEGNVVYTIDDLPALDQALRYSGIDINKVEKEDLVFRISRNFQLELHRDNAFPIMRTPTFADLENKAIVFAGSVPMGSKVKFCLLPGFEVTANLIKEYEEYQKEISTADAMILFSCAGRELSLGPWIEEEIDGIQQIWNSPLVGFFTNGEIGPDKNGNVEFYNMTCSLVLLSQI